MRHLATATLLVFASGACNAFTNQAAVHVRFRNATPWVITGVSLTSPGNTLHTDRLAPGEVSRYERQDGAYPYGALRIRANDMTRRVIPIDYDGERALPAGDYTYVIRYTPTNPDSVSLALQRDR